MASPSIPTAEPGDDYAHLTTTDPDVAKKYDMHDESEFFDDEDHDEVAVGKSTVPRETRTSRCRARGTMGVPVRTARNTVRGRRRNADPVELVA